MINPEDLNNRRNKMAGENTNVTEKQFQNPETRQNNEP